MARKTTTLSADRIKELARDGAEKLLKQLRAEIIAIERTFPELALPKGRKAVKKSVKRARKMSEEARKAVSARMKKYWAERKRAKAKAK